MKLVQHTQHLEVLRARKPLVICLTNDVVKNFTANGLLALGASPVMSGCIEDLRDLMPFADALLINIGTITPAQAVFYKEAAQLANLHHVPVVLDPVACGAGAFRKSVALELLTECNISVLRGNAGEIAALVDEKIDTKGVDSLSADHPGPLAQKAAIQYDAVVLATGATDGIACAHGYVETKNGSSLMPQVVGTGCLLGAVVAAFAGVSVKDEHFAGCEAQTCDNALFVGVQKALAAYNIAGEMAEVAALGKGPGTFAVEFLNALDKVNDDIINNHTRFTATEGFNPFNDAAEIRKQLAVYFICGTQDFGGDVKQALQTIEEALKSGITMFQLREKGEGSLTGEVKVQFAKHAQSLCKQYKVPFIVNDDMDLAEQLDADGVHIGQDDDPIEEVRQRFSHKIIGLSIHNLEEYKISNVRLADYIGVGPIHGTQSKADAKGAVGYEGVAKIRQFDPSVPIVAIGGITAADVAPLKAAGSDGVSVISAITKATDVAAAVNELK